MKFKPTVGGNSCGQKIGSSTKLQNAVSFCVFGVRSSCVDNKKYVLLEIVWWYKCGTIVSDVRKRCYVFTDAFFRPRVNRLSEL